MNQILSTEAPKSNNKVRGGNRAPADIEKILKFFAIGMIIFGIFMIGIKIQNLQEIHLNQLYI